MEIIELIQERNFKTIKEEPQYFGGFLNMALLNVLNVNNHFAKDFGYSLLQEDAHINGSFLCNCHTKEINRPLLYARVNPFIPVLKVFDPEVTLLDEDISVKTNIDFKVMSESLKSIFDELQDLRNHYFHDDLTTRTAHGKSTVSLRCKQLLQSIFKCAIERTQKRFKGVFTTEDFSLATKIQLFGCDETITQEGLVFLTCLFLEREYAFQFISKIKELKGTQYKMFLATRETFMAFCVQLPHSKFVSSDKKQTFIFDVISELNKCPKELYNVISENEKEQFLPQLEGAMAQRLFENSLSDDAEPYGMDYDAYMSSCTKKIRGDNRFCEFALRFIEENDLLPNYRFQLNLGSLLVSEYTKMFDGQEVPRRIVECVKTPGKLSDFLDEAAAVRKIVTTEAPSSFEEFSPCYHVKNNKIGLHTKWEIPKLIPQNNTNKADKKLVQHQPDAFLSLHELQKIILLNYLKPQEPQRLIDAFLNSNDKLLSWPFIQEIKELMPKNWNEFNRRADTKNKSGYSSGALHYLLNRKAVLNEVLDPYHFNDKQIPQRILDYWLNIKDVDIDKATGERIKQMKRDCMKRLKAVRKYRDEHKGSVLKVGAMASFLAKDILDMIISVDKKKKITGFYYDKMQECLAFFADAEMKAQFIRMVTNELNLNDRQGHPFLFKLNLQEINNTPDFYEKYLCEKGEKLIQRKNFKTGRFNQIDVCWLRRTFYSNEYDKRLGRQMTGVRLPDDITYIPYSIKQAAIKEQYDLKQWLSHKLNGKVASDKKQAANLPTNLFDEALKIALSSQLTKRGVQYNDDVKWNELFKIWWYHCGDSFQPFYAAERSYNVYEEEIVFNPDTANHFADYYRRASRQAFEKIKNQRMVAQKTNRRLPPVQYASVERVFKKAIAGTEKKIRLIKEEDRVLLLMLKQMDLHSNIKLEQADSLLGEHVDVKQVVNAKLYFNSEGVKAKTYEQMSISRTITAHHKRKDFRMLRKFVFDHRLPELLEYFDEEAIDVTVLKAELEAYSKAKQMVFDVGSLLQKCLVTNHTQSLNQALKDSNGSFIDGHVQHKFYLDWLKHEDIIDNNTWLFTNMVYDCFSHNRFPHKKTMELFVDHWDDSLFAQQIAYVYSNKLNDVLEKIR